MIYEYHLELSGGLDTESVIWATPSQPSSWFIDRTHYPQRAITTIDVQAVRENDWLDVLWRRNRRLKDGDCERQACMRPTDDRILSIPRLARLGTRRASGSDSMKDLELVDRARA